VKILILNHNLKEQGNYFRALKFAQYLADKNHNVTLVTSSDRWYKTRKYYVGKVYVIESPSWSFVIGIDMGWSPLGLLYRLWLVMKNKYDIVYGFSHKIVDFIPAYFSKIFKKSFYITDWCDWYGKGGIFVLGKEWIDKNFDLSRFRKFILVSYYKMEEYLEEFVPKRADMVSVICKALYNRAIGIGIKEENLIQLFSGADTDSIKPVDKTEARQFIKLNSILGIPEKQWCDIDVANKCEINLTPRFTILGYVANYHFDETLLFEAFSIVCKKNKNVKLLAVGPDFSTRKEKLKELGLSLFNVSTNNKITPQDNIIYFGRRPFKEIKYFLGASDILLLPMTDVLANRGRWPHKTGDYLSSGRPIVVNNVGDIPDIFKGNNAGYIAEPNAEDFAFKIIQMIQDKDKWEEYGKNTRQVAETVLSWQNIGNKLYHKLKEKISDL